MRFYVNTTGNALRPIRRYSLALLSFGLVDGTPNPLLCFLFIVFQVKFDAFLWVYKRVLVATSSTKVINCASANFARVSLGGRAGTSGEFPAQPDGLLAVAYRFLCAGGPRAQPGRLAVLR